MKPKRRLSLITSAIAVILIGLVLWRSLRHEQLYEVTVLPTLGGLRTVPRAVNDYGQVVGIADDPSNKKHLFLWDHKEWIAGSRPSDALGCRHQ